MKVGMKLKKHLIKVVFFTHRTNLRKNNLLHNTNFHGLLPLTNPNKLQNLLSALYDPASQFLK